VTRGARAVVLCPDIRKLRYDLDPSERLAEAEGLALAIGVVEGWTKVFYSEASNTVIFVLMALVLLLRPKGLFGREGMQ
jgi:hypothetical protein